MSLEALINDKPYLVSHLFPSGRMMAEGANNEMHCMCFTCIGKVTEPVSVGVIQPASDKENFTTNNPIENCLWDNIVVSTSLTNAVSRTKKGEPLKPMNATHLQGFCINGKLLPTASIVKDHLQRWAIRHNKRCARQLTNQPLCEVIVQWKADHNKSVVDGTVELINPSTNSPLRFNMKRFVNVIFGHIMLPQLAKCGRVLTAGDLKDGKSTNQDLFHTFLEEYNSEETYPTPNMLSNKWMTLLMLLISLHFQSQNGKTLGGGLER